MKPGDKQSVMDSNGTILGHRLYDGTFVPISPYDDVEFVIDEHGRIISRTDSVPVKAQESACPVCGHRRFQVLVHGLDVLTCPNAEAHAILKDKRQHESM